MAEFIKERPLHRQSKLALFLRDIWQRFTAACQTMQLFQARIWIVSIQKKMNEQGPLLNDTFVVSEDSFSSPMSWMPARGYSEASINELDMMQCSHLVTICIGEQYHSLMRVK